MKLRLEITTVFWAEVEVPIDDIAEAGNLTNCLNKIYLDVPTNQIGVCLLDKKLEGQICEFETVDVDRVKE